MLLDSLVIVVSEECEFNVTNEAQTKDAQTREVNDIQMSNLEVVSAQTEKTRKN
jgi:hypothetical protein